MSGYLTPDERLTVTEAAAVTMLPGEVVTGLAAGPLAPDEAGRLTLRQVLGIEALSEMGALRPEIAVPIAHTAASEARAGGDRLLAVGSLNGVPSAAWVASVSAELRRFIVLFPADRTLTTLAARLAEHRAAAGRPN